MRRIIPAGAAVLALAGGGAGVAVAASSKPAQRPAAVFQEQLAKELGVSPSKLRDAAEAAAKSTIEQLEADGTITADRAAKLQERLERGGGLGLGRPGGPGRHRAAPLQALDAEAKALGMDRAALLAELRKGTTPADLIRSKGKDPAAVADAVRTAVRDALQPAVDAGRLTDAQADARAADVAERLTADEPVGRHRHRGPRP